MADEGPIYVAENSNGVKQVKLDIISSAQNGSMRSEEFATIQFLARDVEIAPRDVISEMQETMGAWFLSAPRKAYVKMSPEAIAAVGVDVGGTKYIWLDGADAEDKIGLIGEGWRKIEISQGEIAQYQSVYGTAGVQYSIYVNDNIPDSGGGRGPSGGTSGSAKPGSPVGIVIADTAEVVRNDRPDTTGNLDIEKVGARYGGLSEDEIRELGDNLILGDATVVATKDDADDPDNISYRGSDPQMVRAKKGDDIVQTGSGDDEIDGGFGNDTLKGGDGRDAIEGGPGNDIIDGGSNGSREGDEAIFAGNSSDYTIIQKTDDGSGTVTGLRNQVYFTVIDNNTRGGAVFDEGTDTIFNVEGFYFRGDDMFFDTLPEINTRGNDSFQRGTPFGDTLTGGAGLDVIEGNGGNDVIVGEADSDRSAQGDALSGGQGNDFIDGRGQGTGENPWENLNRAEYYEAPKTRYSVEPKTLNEIKTLVANTSDNIEFNAAITGSYLDSVSASDGFYLVTDSVASNLGGTGTDILVNIQQIEFNDGPMPLGLIIENQMDGRSVVAKFIEGTNYDDNVAKKAETKNINIRDKSGNDRLILGEGADQVELGKGNDFIDGGINTNSNSDERWRTVDEVQIRGDFANFTVEQKTKAEIQTLISNGLSVNANLTTTTSDTNEIGDYANNTKFFVVKDLNTGSSGLGTNILVNVERINFEDGYKNLAVSVEAETEDYSRSLSITYANWQGTFGDDVMNADQLKSTYDSSQPDPTNSSNLISDTMDGGVGDDILFGGKFGDTLKGGVGNDILDGGPAGSLPNGAPDWLLWQTFDAAMNDGNFSRYQIKLHKIPASGTVVVEDILGVDTFTINSSREVFGHSANGTKDGSASHTFASGTTQFYSVTDTLPASFGGEGTDILANLTGIRFLDKDFQLSPVIESFQGPEGAEQMTMGTTFDDYIDLTGGNAAQTSTTITSAINNSATSIPVASTDGLPMSGYIKIGSEEIYYRDITRDTLDATGGRGANGTSAGSHSNGATATVDGRNQVEPGKGNDFIRGGDGKDFIQGSIDNDFIDGGGNKMPPAGSHDTWKYNDEVMYSGPMDRYTLSSVTTSELSSLISGGLALNAGLDLSASRYQSKNFIKVVDALSSDAGGEGTDILFDIEEIMFNDDHVSLATREEIRTEHRGGSSVNVGFIEGTFQSETLQWSGSSVNFVNIRAGKGDDLLVGGSGADRFEPQAGNDTINGAGDNTASYNGSDGQHFFEYADSVRFSGDPNRFTISKENVKFSNNKAVFLTDVDSNSNNVWDNTGIAKSGEYASTAPKYLDTNSSTGSGYETAFVIKDSLPASKGGMGTNVVQNVEVFEFGEGSNWNQVVTILKKKTEVVTEDSHYGRKHKLSFSNDVDSNSNNVWDNTNIPKSGPYSSTAPKYTTLHKLEGTDFNDVITVATVLSSDNVLVKIRGSKGNDTIIGASNNFTRLQYDGSISEFKITPNYSGSTLSNITVKHNTTASDGGYGTDTISKIESIDFIDGQVSLEPHSWTERSGVIEAYEGTILNDTITVTTVDSNSDSINDKYLSGYGSAGSDTFIGSNNIPTDYDAHGDDNVSYNRLYYLPELTLAKSGSNVTVTKPGGAVDTLTKIDWIITKGDSGSIKTLLTPFTDTESNTYRGSVFDDTSSVSSSSIDYAVLGPGNDTYTYSANSEEHIVTPGTGDDTINFTGNGGHSVMFEGSFERYDVSFWDGSSVSSGKKVLDKIYAPGDKVVVTDNLALSSGGTGQDVITGATDLYFSNGRQNLKMVIQMPDGEGGFNTLFNAYDGNNHELGTGAAYNLSSPTIGFVDFMNVHVDTVYDSRDFTTTTASIPGLGKHGFSSAPSYVSGMKVDLSVSADLTTLTNYVASSFGFSERFIKDYEDVPSAYRGKEFYGTTGSDYVKGTSKVERFHGDQGNDTYIGGGSPGVVINSVSSSGEVNYTLNAWQSEDRVKYNADLSRYEITQHTDANGSVTGTSGKAYIKVQDKVSRDGLGDGKAIGNKVFGTGLDTLVDIGIIEFADTKVWTKVRTETHSYNSGQDLDGDGSNDSVTVNNYQGSQFNDTITVSAAAHNRIEGSAGNDTITGKGNYSNLPLAKQIAVGNNYHNFAEIVQYKAAQDYFNITVNNNGSITVADTRTGLGSYGTDIITGIDILEFESGTSFSKYALAPLFSSHSNQGSLTLTVNSSSGFKVGETVKGGTSNKESEILYIPNSTTISVRTLSSGDYTDNETLTGSTSGATATMSASNIKNVTNLRVTDPGINNNYATLSVGNYSSIEYQDGGGSDQYYGVKAKPNTVWEGDSVFYNADQDSFNVRIEPDDGAGNTVVKVDDFRGSAVVTDTLYNIETIRFYSETGGSGIELVPTFEDYNNFETGNDSFRGTVFDDVIVADAGRNYVQGQAGNDNLIGNVDGDHFNPGAGHDFINGVAATSTSGDPWQYRNSVEMSVSSDRMTISNVFVELENIGTQSAPVMVATRNSDGTFKTYTSDNKPSGAVSVVYIVDDLDAESGDSVATNILYNVDSVRFSDDVEFEFSGFSDERDFDGDGVIDEVFKEGTPFADTLTGSAGNDIIDGRENDDNLIGGAGGDMLIGGAGNDVINGGADGTSGDPWRDMDVAEYRGIQARYTVSSKKTDTDSNSDNVWDNTLIAKSGDYASKAPVYYTVTDSLGESLGGTGVDQLTGIESIRFSDEEIELGMRLQSFDFDGDGTIDFSEINGTSAADLINPTEFSLGGDDEIRGKGGDDVIDSGAGGDRIDGGAGDDKINGGENGKADAFGFTPKDEVIYQASSSRFTVSDALTDTNGSVTGTKSQVYFTVTDTLPAALGGFGTDTIWNVEFINFIDEFIPLGVDTFINYDENNVEIGRFVNGTRSGETLNGGDANDDLNGRAGNDIIYGFGGSDYIEGGKGNDIIYGGKDGKDSFGNVIGDTVRYKGNKSKFDITSDPNATLNGETVTAIKVSHTVANGQGDDTLYGVEYLQFDDVHVGVAVTSSTEKYEDGSIASVNYQGSVLSDTITGTSDANFIDGGEGGDTLRGEGGADTFVGGLGNDTIYGGVAGKDRWGNDGVDVVVYSGPSTNYTIQHYKADKTAVDSYDLANPGGAAGYFTVKDAISDAKGGTGTDTIYGVEAIEFSDKVVSFETKKKFVDVDGDGFPDMGVMVGTDGNDTITGMNLDEMLQGEAGNDYILGGSGGDILIGGAGNDTLIGGADGIADSFGVARPDVAEISMSMASITGSTFTTGKYVALNNATGEYKTEAAGTGENTYDNVFSIEVYASNSDVPSGHSAEAAVVLTNGSEKDLLVGVEGVEFTDGFVSLAVESRTVDIDKDGIADKQFVRGTGIADSLTGGTTDDDIDAGPGNDTILSGAGDDYIMPGAGNDTIVADTGNDVVEINGNASTITTVYVALKNGAYLAESSSVGASAYNGVFAYEVYASGSDVDTGNGYTAVAAKYVANGSSDKNLLIGVEGIQFNDQFTQLEKREKALDADGDGTTDTVVLVDGSDNSLAPSSGNEGLAHILDGGAGADNLAGGTAGDRFIPGSGADFINGGANTGTGVDGRPSVDVVEYFGTSVTTTTAAANYSVTQVYVLENANGTNTVDFSNGLADNADYYSSESAATSAKSSSQSVTSAFLVTESASSETDLLVGVEIIEFTDGIVQTAPTTTTEKEFTVANGDVEISSINGTSYVDTITSTSGNDIMIGNGGLDKFVFAAGSGDDRILDFTVTGTDSDGDGTADSFEQIYITKDSSTVGINKTSITTASDVLSRITSSSDGALIDFGSENSLTLVGVSSTDLTASHFAIV